MGSPFDLPMTYEVTDLERHSYNAAFYELGLRWHWDQATFRELRQIADGPARLQHYMKQHQPHMLTAYDCSFLHGAIEQVRSAALASMIGMAHDGQATSFDWSEFQRAPVGI